MRITFISPTVNLSGGVRVMFIYAKYLMRRGHTVCIVSPPLRKILFSRKLKTWLKGSGWPRASSSPKTHVDASEVTHHVLDNWRPVNDRDLPDADIVIATWWETAEWVNMLAPSKGAKVYFIQHHEVFPHLPIERVQATYRMPLHKVAVAAWLKDVMATQYGDNVVDVVPNSVDREQFFAVVRGKQARPTVGLLYSPHSLKGVDTALRAIGIVRKKLPSLRIVCFGADPQQPGLTLPDGAEFILTPPQEQIREIYARCDVWITASLSEGFNLPAMEAMACRTPVVATRTGWPAEAVVTRENGVLVDVGDVNGLAEGVLWVLSRSEEEWKSLSDNAYATAASGSWEESGRHFEAALKHACERSKRGEIAGRCASAL
jgi:glycosyltransferase involved in cell wall biosynthesis